MFTRKFLIGASLAGSTVLASVTGAAFAQQTTPIVGISTVTTYAAIARVTAVDTAARTVTLAYTNGAVATRKVSPSVANFAQTKIGDTVVLGLEDKLTFVLSGPNAKPPRDRDVSVTTATSGANSALGLATDQEVATWWVTGVDTANGRISVVNPAGGEVRTYNVATPEGRAQLPRVKTGDYLTAIDSQIAVVSIAPN